MQYRLNDSSWDSGSIECFEFLNDEIREHEVITVYSPDDKRVGLIVRQSALFSDDPDIIANKCLSNYASCWLKDQLSVDYSSIQTKLDEMVVDERVCYMFVHKESLKYASNISHSVSAFLFCNCLSVENRPGQFLSPETGRKVRERLENERLRLLSIYSNEASKYFVEECIPKIKETNDSLSQFIVLYQYFEILMEISFEPKLKSAYSNYEQHVLSKNDFRQAVSDLSKESSLLSELLKDISNKAFAHITDDEKKRYLNNEKITSATEVVYKLRNEIFHRTRKFIRSDSMLKKSNYAVLLCIYECVVKDILNQEAA